MRSYLFTAVFAMPFLFVAFCQAQPRLYSTANGFFYNEKADNYASFFAAIGQGFGAVETVIDCKGAALQNFETACLRPLDSLATARHGYIYGDSSKHLLIFLRLKNCGQLNAGSLVALFKKYQQLSSSAGVEWVLNGDVPPQAEWGNYPPFISFEGDLSVTYSQQALARIAIMSGQLAGYGSWAGKSNLPAGEKASLMAAVTQAHQLNKPVFFRNTPDAVNTWEQLVQLNVDYIASEQVDGLPAFLNKLAKNSFYGSTPYRAYQPAYRVDNSAAPAKNIILLIGDGMGLAQLYAGYTANRGSLTIFNMLNTGLSKTSSYDSYVTDSGPGSTAFASGQKSKNRSVGVDSNGHPISLLPQIMASRHMHTGLITCGDVTDATPADFYAHRNLRDSSAAIFSDLANSPIQLLMGSGNRTFNGSLRDGLQQKGFAITSAIDSIPGNTTGKWLAMEKQAALPMLKGRDNWLGRALDKTLTILKGEKEGFFVMAEGAQIDLGGHANSMPYMVTEVLDFDQVVAQALKFADNEGHTLVLVIADHETGGLSLLDGDYGSGYVSGQFSTNDHSAVPVPVFAYGPRSGLFRGVYENTEMFTKMLSALGIK